MRRTPLLVSSSVLVLLAATSLSAQGIESYSPVTPERLASPEPGNWLSIRRTYDGQGHSPLNQITPENVAGLKEVWSAPTGPYQQMTAFAALPADPAHEAPVLMNDGVMVVATPDNQVVAYNAADGKELWRYAHSLPAGLIPVHPTNRGVALLGDKVFFATLDARLVALDAKTGEKVWDRALADWQQGYYFTMAPLAADGKIMVGVSGGEFGIRGFVEASDPETGESVWKTYTIPEPGQPGSETWPGDAWKTGGGPVWITGTYDPERNIAYWGVGNAAPWPGVLRPGDNLYTASTIGLDAETGEIVTHFQYHPNDTWDWDETVPPTLMELDGENLAVKFARNGYVYKLRRDDAGSLSFVEGTNYVFQNAFDGLDPETGRAIVNEENRPKLGERAEFCPSAWGGRDYPYDAYNPDLGYIFVPVNENHCGAMEAAEVEYEPGVLFLGSGLEMTPTEAAKDHIGAVQAWDVRTMEKVWQTNFKSPMWGPMLSTGGGVIFSGGTNDAEFRAFDAKTGEILWNKRLDGGIMSPPISFEMDGKQHIAVLTGWGVDGGRFQGFIDAAWGTETVTPQGGTLYVFALE
ncbi:PQQ-dependent dehydrogenase, methanol/ethanol family [Paracoccus sediminis]|uniref:Alcohol dehydrogenase (Cytochrome c) n=1 Tax=Paracoccus sediminis TaxID=1214787 RepID=A0A238YFH4_9RHOB|nr:PQQ-dependent dehydrogenase, methanol/ethanol family [Paracoccus sediminis]TBN46635.1 PQQ-dependent dehydrogenase, methanol/ethanol family [Paracoccus sediminis]SNR69975.1 alcohol dehydrogenase (cytochrome c) [Paracoccus sediminis]